jgi:uncharacterized RDD family membrane protein YckC
MNSQNLIVLPNVYASKEKRFINYIVDKIIFYALLLVFFFILGIAIELLSADSKWFWDFMDDLENVNPWLDRLYTAIIFIILYMISEIILKGRTIGKYITKTKVVLKDGSKPKVSDIILRSLCRLIPFDALSFLGSEGRGWHDSVSDTYVVDVKKFNAKRDAKHDIDRIGETIDI